MSSDHFGILFWSTAVHSGFSGPHMADRPKQAMIVGLGDIAQRRHFDNRRCRPEPWRHDDLDFVKSVDGFNEGVVIVDADTANLRQVVGLDQAHDSISYVMPVDRATAEAHPVSLVQEWMGMD
jgi:hypothetical protein